MNESQVPPVESAWDDSLAPIQPGWPKVVGIISIVLGSISVLCGVCGIAWGGFIAPAMMPPDQQVPVGLFVSPAQMVLGGIGFLFNILLIVAGAMTVGRKPVGRILHLVFAAASIVLFFVGIPLALQQQAVMEQWARDNPGHVVAKGMQGPGGKIGPMIGLAIGAVFGLGYPLFLVVWFGFIKRKPNSMTGGMQTDEPAA